MRIANFNRNLNKYILFKLFCKIGEYLRNIIMYTVVCSEHTNFFTIIWLL